MNEFNKGLDEGFSVIMDFIFFLTDKIPIGIKHFCGYFLGLLVTSFLFAIFFVLIVGIMETLMETLKKLISKKKKPSINN